VTPVATALSRLNMPTRTIFGGLVTVVVATLAVRTVSVAREVLVARDFGVGRSVDAFVVAYLIPGFAIAVVSGSANAALIPTYVRLRENRGTVHADRLAGSILTLILVVLAAVAAALATLMPQLLSVLAPGFDESTRKLALSLSYLLLPLIPLTGAATLFAAVLNSHRRFAFAALAPLASPCFAIAALLFGGGRIGVSALAVGLLIGGFAELAVVIYAATRGGNVIRPCWVKDSIETSTVIRQWAPVAFGAAAMSTSPLIDQSMASTLGAGSVSSLSYGSKLVALLITLTALAVGTVFTPYLSSMLATNDFEGVRRTVLRYLRWIAAITVPIALIVVLLSPAIVASVFARGAFSGSDVSSVSSIQRLLVLQLPFYVGGILLVRLISALRANRLILWGAIINVGVNLGGNYVLMQTLGVRGIALSTSLVYVVSFGYLVLAATRAFNRARYMSTVST
jgi:putative peptidoglycan lipid II flippase